MPTRSRSRLAGAASPSLARGGGPSRLRAPRHERGHRAETACADYLFARGFSVLARNLRVGYLEIDLVARRGPLVVIVEVRTRGTGSYERPLASVSPTKRQRLLRAADRLWRGSLGAMPGVERIRLDVAAVSLRGGVTIEYVEGAIAAGFNARL